MAEVIAFPQRVETKTLHFDEKHAFGEIGGLMLSLVQEQGHPEGPVTLVLLGGVDGFLPLESFEPTPEGFEAAQAAGEMALRVLAVGHTNWAE
ncbi:hypothetical protein JKG68_28900 [Microvirga aerilata]|jgi:hypothetical protein|uniref:Uncharacterized protein n=1 Tax=Microvirga aerilata TaxID=670292 RepID=A0A936ZDN4_9HYPH|nr:hypothetical protein [Microvirga aerilata]MBL0407921.1 hypothetical protein [Microvirga aerilata]